MLSRADIDDALNGTHPRYGRQVEAVVIAIIILSALSIMLDSMPEIPDRFRGAIRLAEFAFLLFFLAEYVIRLICAPKPLRYAFSFWGIVDFLSCVPALLLVIPDAQAFRMLRLLRLVRLLKLLRYGNAFDRLGTAFASIRDELIVTAIGCGLVLYLSAVGIYLFEHHAQPENFPSIPASLWWSLATLTTVGYGDVYPVTTGGKVFTGLILMIGLGIVAIPAGLLSSALTQAAQAKRDAAAKPLQPDQTER